VIRASHKTEHYKSCSLVQPGAPMTRPGFSPGLISGHSTYGVAGLLAAQSIDAIDTTSTQPRKTHSEVFPPNWHPGGFFKSFVSEEGNGFALPQCTSLLAALGPSQTAVCPSTSIQEPKQWPSRATLPNVSQAMVMHSSYDTYASWRNQDTICPGQLMSLSSSSIRTCL
jgi:hypothetical protein